MTAHSKNGAIGADIRAKLDHPILDGDSHIVEYGPAVMDFLKQVAGPDMVERARKYSMPGNTHRDIWWSRPSGAHSIDTITAMLPKLYRERLDDIGIDFAILYSSQALASMHIRDDELRPAMHRALNTMFADMFAEVSDRLAPSAVIPMHTPEEAIAELEYAVGELGLKAITVNSEVRRPHPEVEKEAPHLAPFSEKVYSLAVDSQYDYDPFWQRCIDLKVAPSCHTKTMGGGSTRAVTNNFIFNHLGSFASGGEFLCRSVFMGGVTRRFPELNFAFQEGGVAWACALYNDICEHWEKRNIDSLKENLNPHTFDIGLMVDMFEKYGNAYLSAERAREQPYFRPLDLKKPEDELDEFAACRIEKAEDIRELFTERFYFGCEADDLMVPCAFNPDMNHFGARLNATLSSDLGHWDVVDMLKVLPEAYEFVEKELLSPGEFRDFAFANQVRMLGGMNPDFFKGTVIEHDAQKVLDAMPARTVARAAE